MLSSALQRQKRFLSEIKLYMNTCTIIISLLVLIAFGLTWFATNAQIGISTTLTYSGREHSLTQKILAESLLVVYAKSTKARKDLQTDQADWNARHDAIWQGSGKLQVVSVNNYPDILPTVRQSEGLYLPINVAITDILTNNNPVALRNDATLINKDAVPFYNAMENYNTYLRNLTTSYQTTILIYGIISTVAILATLLLSVFFVFRPAFIRLNTNVLDIADSDEKIQNQRQELLALLEEVRRSDHGTRLPITKIGEGSYAVQNGAQGFYTVTKTNKGIFECPCPIYVHNHYCLHVKHVLIADREQALYRSPNTPTLTLLDRPGSTLPIRWTR